MDIMSQLGLSLVRCSFMCGKTHKTSSDHCQTALLSRILLLRITHERPRQQAEKPSEVEPKTLFMGHEISSFMSQ